MKICFLVHGLGAQSGWGRYAKEIIERVALKNYEVKVFSEVESDDASVNSIRTDSAGSARFLERGLLRGSMNNPFFIFWNAWRIRKYLKNCDIIHCFDGYPYGIIGALANIGLNKKLIINGVGTYSVLPLTQLRYGFLLKWAYKKAHRILCISHFTCREIIKRVPNLENLNVVNLGVDLNKFKSRDLKFKDYENNIKIILSVGALKARKGYHISIPAVGLIKDKYPNLKYYIIGDQSNSKYFRKLQELVKEYNLENNVIFLENLSDEELLKIYNQADLFLLTPINERNSFEGFGLVYLEANACGKPVIGTRNCGAEDIIESGYNGFLVFQRDADDTAKAIAKILDDSELAKNMGENGRRKAEKMTWDKTIENYAGEYNNLMK